MNASMVLSNMESKWNDMINKKFDNMKCDDESHNRSIDEIKKNYSFTPVSSPVKKSEMEEAPNAPVKKYDKMKREELFNECKRRGLKTRRKLIDMITDLLANDNNEEPNDKAK